MTDAFTPLTFRSGHSMKNRIALAPLTNQQSNADGTLSDVEFNWLMHRAKGGFGMIITCAANVTKDGPGGVGEIGVYDDKHVDGLRRLAAGIHEQGALGVVQIFHGGIRAPEEVTGTRSWSASETVLTRKTGAPIAVREGTVDDIQRVIKGFGQAAARVKKAGLDGVELHGAHGYLLSQFLSKKYNQRKDEWGGSLENRARLMRRCLTEARRQCGSDFIIGVRISPEDYGLAQGLDFDENLQLTRWLVEDGADFIHISIWDTGKKPDKYPEGATIIERFREVIPSDVPMLAAGKISDRKSMEKTLALGADVAAVGTAAIGNPDWAARVAEPGYEMKKPPFTKKQLSEKGLGDVFIDYMKRWPGFVAD